ncbi:hypothetical protein [Actinocorallia aurantiaca]|uniref:Uncharacterized protein n=1 Tax=Actinocorallia aurantiaca TaxID=46204 RepID=A0ABN3U8R1_9ACTN
MHHPTDFQALTMEAVREQNYEAAQAYALLTLASTIHRFTEAFQQRQG